MRALTWIVGLLLWLGCQAAAGAEPRKFAVLSLIGDRLLIVSHDVDIGTRLDRNRREFVEMPARVLDNAIVSSMGRAIKETGEAEVMMLGGNASLYAAQGEPSEDPDLRPVIDLVKPALEKSGVAQLVLATKVRHDAMLRLANVSVGSGKLEGVGFYLDQTLRTRRSDTGTRGQGFLAPFAYFRVSLIDVASGEVLSHRDVFASTSASAARSPSLLVWESLDAAQKARIINGLTQHEAARAVQDLLQAR